MKLNDPFGRVGRRRSRAHDELTRRLRERGVHDVASVKALAGTVTRTALLWTAVTLLSTALAVLLFPAQRGVVGVLGVLILLWIASNWFQTRMHLHRYQNELDPNTRPDREGEDR